MSERSADNPPAFPGGVVPGPDYHAPLNPGMTLRDWFAGQALAGISWGDAAGGQLRNVAAAVWDMADAMMAAREEKEE